MLGLLLIQTNEYYICSVESSNGIKFSHGGAHETLIWT